MRILAIALVWLGTRAFTQTFDAKVVGVSDGDTIAVYDGREPGGAFDTEIANNYKVKIVLRLRNPAIKNPAHSSHKVPGSDMGVSALSTFRISTAQKLVRVFPVTSTKPTVPEGKNPSDRFEPIGKAAN